MKTSHEKIVFLAFIFISSIFIANTSNAYTNIQKNITIDIKPLDKTITNGSVDLQVTIETKVDICELEYILEHSENIIYAGEKRWKEKIDRQQQSNFLLNISLPKDSVSYLAIEIHGKRKCSDRLSNELGFSRCFFDTRGDTLEIYSGPSLGNKLKKSEELPPRNREHAIPGEFPLYDSLYGVPENQSYFVPYDATDTLPRVVSEPKMTIDSIPHNELMRLKMLKLEKEPLTKGDFQSFYIDGVVWERRRGEYKFKPAESVKFDDIPIIDNINTDSLNYPPDKEIEVLLDLRDSTKLEIAVAGRT